MRLYALLDEASLQRHGWSIERFVRRAMDLNAEIVQYRNKNGTASFIESRLKTITKLFGGKVIVNDHPELSDICDGVHLGQDDVMRYGTTIDGAVESLRNIVGHERWIGLSTHNRQEIETANRLDIDYVGLGACRATSTKSDANPLGCKKLSKLASLSKHPVAAIGGVKLDDVIEHVTWIVVGSGLYDD
ncbi:MAG: hypothetical protein B6D59_06550 [Campylobacteraceae bacterium 4484_4]|uniref:thiamine phosphate synthase n=1 Tax=Hydrogenimonas sp. TaxID=2231112 RepID=UPI000A0B42E1|nr:thiamine phosphate synthase [Hydrogenimonas sp.]OQX73118.1 MAG: hypothetical protein B6D59_06550 [Campylobacteraceae bacterium 4484_4]